MSGLIPFLSGPAATPGGASATGGATSPTPPRNPAAPDPGLPFARLLAALGEPVASSDAGGPEGPGSEASTLDSGTLDRDSSSPGSGGRNTPWGTEGWVALRHPLPQPAAPPPPAQALDEHGAEAMGPEAVTPREGEASAAARDVRSPRSPEEAPALRHTEGVAPELVARVQRVVERMWVEHGHTVEVVEGHRDQARQDRLYAQGRTAPGPVVTWTRHSAHTRGHAMDVMINGGWDDIPAFRTLQEVAAEEGLRTLGMRDPGHLELPRTSGAGGETVDSTRLRSGNTAAMPAPAPVVVGRTGIAQVAQVARVARPGMGQGPAAAEAAFSARETPRSLPEALPASPTANPRGASVLTAEAVPGHLPRVGSGFPALFPGGTPIGPSLPLGTPIPGLSGPEGGTGGGLTGTDPSAAEGAGGAGASTHSGGDQGEGRSSGGNAGEGAPRGEGAHAGERTPAAFVRGLADGDRERFLEQLLRSDEGARGSIAGLGAGSGIGGMVLNGGLAGVAAGGSIPGASTLLRAEQVRALQASGSSSGPLQVNLANVDGLGTDLQLGLRGNAVSAQIGALDPVQARALRLRLGDLRSALQERGLEADRLGVRWTGSEGEVARDSGRAGEGGERDAARDAGQESGRGSGRNPGEDARENRGFRQGQNANGTSDRDSPVSGEFGKIFRQEEQ